MLCVTYSRFVQHPWSVTAERRITRGFLDFEDCRMKHCPDFVEGGLKKTMKSLAQSSQYCGLYLNPKPPEDENG